MEPKQVTVVFQPSGRRGQIEIGKSILEAAQELGVALESVCGGKHVCGKCRVRIEEGFYARDGLNSSRGHLSPFSAEEQKFINPQEQESGYRLACIAQLNGDALVYLPEESRGKKQVIRKEVRDLPFNLNPGVKPYFVELIPPTLAEPLADFERLSQALEKEFGLKRLLIDFLTLKNLPQNLREKNWQATVLVWMDREILEVIPGRAENYYGVAVDIGTTTVALYLCNLKNGKVEAADSIMN
ncbi:MAG: ferredoxin, partial [Deltaproteobacteria bacterium]